jgi:prepilin-type processing-associated H-X9-DG protein
MIVTVTLDQRWVDQNGAVNYAFADGYGLQYSSVQDASENAVLTDARVVSVLRDLVISIAESTDANGTVTATFDSDAADGAVVRVKL